MSTLLAPHLVHLRAAGYAANTVHDRERLLRHADRELPYGVDTPTVEEITTWLARPGWSAWTRHTYYNHLVGFYAWACEGDAPYLDHNPIAGLKRPKPGDADPDPVTDDELADALNRSDDRWRLAITCAAFAGLRSGEIGRLRREHVTADTITVWHGKGDRSAKLPTHPEIWRLIEPRPLGVLFPSNGASGTADLTSLQRAHFDSLGMPDIHLHRFRHWYATMLLKQGVDIRTVQTLMRHKSIQTTAGYLLVVDEQRRLANSTLPVPSSPQQEAA
jgi:integrase/recombinase XerD